MLKRLQRLGLRRGVFGNGKGWLYLGIASWGLRTLRRVAEPNPDILLHEELKPGQRVIIANDRGTVDVEPTSETKRRGRRGRRRRRSRAAR